MDERTKKIIGMLGSAHDGEILNAAKAAQRLAKERGVTLAQLLDEGSSAPRPDIHGLLDAAAQIQRLTNQLRDATRQSEHRRQHIVEVERMLRAAKAASATYKADADTLRQERDKARAELTEHIAKSGGSTGRQAEAERAFNQLMAFGALPKGDLTNEEYAEAATHLGRCAQKRMTGQPWSDVEVEFLPLMRDRIVQAMALRKRGKKTAPQSARDDTRGATTFTWGDLNYTLRDEDVEDGDSAHRNFDRFFEEALRNAAEGGFRRR